MFMKLTTGLSSGKTGATDQVNRKHLYPSQVFASKVSDPTCVIFTLFGGLQALPIKIRLC